MIYKKSGDYNTLDDYVKAKTGKTIRGLNRFKASYTIKNLDKVKARLIRAAREGQLIYVYGDYDTDGICSVSEMCILLDSIGASYVVYLPRRFSDGYGINVNTIQGVPDGALLVTVDNGIAAIEALQIAAQRGIETIILDHHMSASDDNGNIIIPTASIIVDPEAFPDGCDWDGYCGAGLVCELAKIMLTPGSLALEYIKTLAAIGTVGDVVPLLSANRQIVRDGLTNLNSGVMPLGLDILKRQIVLTSKIGGPLRSEHLGYYISPCFNAAGRLKDTGAMGVVATILANTPETAASYSAQLINWNKERKSITEDCLKTVEVSPTDRVNVVSGSIPAGCIGLVAGELVKTTGRPSFVVSCNENGVMKGSARSNSPLNNAKMMLDACSDLLLGYGGHAEAAGFSLKAENFQAFHDALNAYPLVDIDTTPVYDLDIENPIYIPSLLTELETVEPFGKGVERPLFRMRVDLTEYPEPTRDGIHLRFKLPGNITGMAFHMAERYLSDGSPYSLYLYGDLQWNYYNGHQSPQMIIKDYERAA